MNTRKGGIESDKTDGETVPTAIETLPPPLWQSPVTSCTNTFLFQHSFVLGCTHFNTRRKKRGTYNLNRPVKEPKEDGILPVKLFALSTLQGIRKGNETIWKDPMLST